ncbi:hypothetical protein [Larkinella sp. C7]|jgi:hypothetical protein|uniref:hypothetical protein n=1 Tax=Larkinella sp. C7 TaxID=2576607 RepID=UPI0011110496|nr:hypothetical protein [Larkinella sp. C7]
MKAITLVKIFVAAVTLMATCPTTILAQVKIGNNPTTIDPSAVLEAESTNKGFLPPRLALTSETDAVTIPTPAKGLLVYHTGTNLKGEGIYVNVGTPASPVWSQVTVQNTTVGVTVAKLNYVGLANSSRTCKAGNLEFRAVRDAPNNLLRLQIRMTAQPTQTTVYNSNRLSWWNTATVTNLFFQVTFTTGDWDQWKDWSVGQLNTMGNDILAWYSFISSNEDGTFYRVSLNTRSGGNASTDFINQVVEAY